jgi:nuclear pore complex protein Nup188
MLFLLEMSTMPSMAEQLAIDGLLGQIGSANITAYLRRGNVSPFADSAGIQRCYNIWVRGILPLLLNMLDAVGDSIGTEVAIFINQFPNLLKQSSEAFDTPETSRTVTRGSTKHITLSICSEVHSLSLIIYILNGFQQADGGTIDIPDVKWDAANVLENVEFWLGARAVLRERILPMGESAALTKQRNDNSGFRTRLEEKIVGELLGIRDVLTEMLTGAGA